MEFLNPFSPFLFISSIVAIITAIITWNRRFAPGATPLFVLLLTMAIWAGANGLLLETKDPNLQITWLNLVTFGAIMGTPAFWAFGVEFTNHKHWLTTRNLILIGAIPVISVLLGWTSEYHNLFYAERNLSANALTGEWDFKTGPFYGVYLTYSYVVVLFTLGIIFRAYRHSASLYRRQIFVILLGSLIPLLGNIIYNLFVGAGEGRNIDPTPLLFIIMGCVFTFGLVQYRLFDLVPVARHALVENMQDGVIVVDSQNRILDANLSALRWLNWKQPSPVGKDVKELLQAWFEQLSNFPKQMYIETEVFTSGDPDKYFDLRIEPLKDREDKLTGRLIVFRDITRQKMAERALRDAHDQLRLQYQEIEALQNELREQTIRDPLTGLFNRRYMSETLEREISRAIRNGSEIGVCMADVDNFKPFNDTHGHKAGDILLQALAEIFTTHSRSEDVVCRYGGEEFLILLPGADIDSTSRRAEDWCRAFEQTKIEYNGKIISTTLSVGVAVFPHNGRTVDELLRLADDALYYSKHHGKNRVSLAGLSD